MSSTRNHWSNFFLLFVASLKKSSSKTNSPAAPNGGQSATSSHAKKYVNPSFKSSSPTANEGRSNSSHTKKYVTPSSESRSPAANGGHSTGDTMTVLILSPAVNSESSKHDKKYLSKSNMYTGNRGQYSAIKNHPNHLQCVAINWLYQDATLNEVCKYVKFDVDIPLTQEDQLEMLMEKFSLTELKSAYFVTMGKVGLEDPSAIMLPYKAHKKIVISVFISHIYDHRCMMYDDAENAFW